MIADDTRTALNSRIDVLFQDDAEVRNARRGLMKALSKAEGLIPDGTITKELSDEWN